MSRATIFFRSPTKFTKESPSGLSLASMRLTACLGLSCVIHVLSCSAYGEHQLPHSLPNRGALLFAQPPLFRSPASQQGLCSRPQQGLCARPILAPLRVPLPLGRVLGAGGGVLRQTSVEDSGVGAVEGAQGGPVEGAPDGGVAKVEKTCLHGVVTAFTGNFDGGRDVVIETLKSATGGKVPLSRGFVPGTTP